MDVSKKAITRITRLCDYFENADVPAGRKQKMSGSVEIRRAVGCISLWPCAIMVAEKAASASGMVSHHPVVFASASREPSIITDVKPFIAAE